MRYSSRHFEAFQDCTNADADILCRHVLGLHVVVRKSGKDKNKTTPTSLIRPRVTRTERPVACQNVRNTATTCEQ